MHTFRLGYRVVKHMALVIYTDRTKSGKCTECTITHLHKNVVTAVINEHCIQFLKNWLSSFHTHLYLIQEEILEKCKRSASYTIICFQDRDTQLNIPVQYTFTSMTRLNNEQYFDLLVAK